jgi:hypothetical protein
MDIISLALGGTFPLFFLKKYLFFSFVNALASQFNRLSLQESFSYISST